MKILTTNSVIKKIILILLVVIMLNNFIMPNYVRADDSFATKLAKGFFGLLARLGDWILQLMQYVMVGQSSLKNLGEYEIMYSPGIIFSNEVPALQIDFIGQNAESKEYKYNSTNIKSEEQIKKLLERCEEENKQIGEPIEFKRKQLHKCIMALFPFEDKNKSYAYTFIQVWNYRFAINSEYLELKDGSTTGGDHAEGWLTLAQSLLNSEHYTSSTFVNDMFKKYSNDQLIEDILSGNVKFSELPEDLKEVLNEEDINVYNQVTCLPLQWSDFNPGSWSSVLTSAIGPAATLINLVNDIGTPKGEFELIDNDNGLAYSSSGWAKADNKYIFIHNKKLCVVEDEDNLFDATEKTTITTYDIAFLDGEDGWSIYVPYIDYALKPQISKWYNALRTVALVGLLSVLVYIGIRIILSSSSAQDKAKYKNMLKDWLVALCILFILHYTMAFMIQFNKALNKIFSGAILKTSEEGNNSDILMNIVRAQISDMDNINGWQAGGYTLMWLTLVILTLMFTFQYLKRVIYMAFLTMIAPLIALTYPLDKIKDGKAQAFSYWIREYIFQCLIQPVHLLLYSMLIGSAIDFAKENVLYAIVALSFMVPAEKIVKEMFGLKSDQGAGGFSAALGGAAVISMMNKLKQARPPKGEGQQGGAKGNGGVRTSNNRTGGANPTSQGGGSNSGALESGGTGESSSSGGGSSAGTTGTTSSGEGSTAGTSSNGSILRGAGRFVKRAVGGPKGIKYRGRKLTGAVGGALGGAVGASIGLATTIAQRRCITISKKRNIRISRRKRIRRKSG